MSAPSLPDILRQITSLAEIRGSAEAVELRRAVQTLDALPPGDAERLMLRGARDAAFQIPGFPPSVSWRVHEIAGGAELVLRAARGGVPVLIRRLLELNAVTADQATVLATQLGIVTCADLEAGLVDGRLRRLPEAVLRNLTAARAALQIDLRPLPLGRAWDLAAQVAALVREIPLVTDAGPSGEVRRFEPLVSTVSVTARASDPAAVIEALTAAGVEDTVHRTPRRAIVIVQQTEVDVRVAAPDDHGSVLFAATGTPAHVRLVTARRNSPTLSASEEDLYAHFGLPWIAPELREGTDEVELASTPLDLVNVTHIRGDLHMHSTYSDGQDPVERMVEASVALGYEYVAITDHSESAAASRTVTLDQLARQRDEIHRLRERYPQIEILHGIEVDILPDGRLDFADAILEQLDIVLASLHDAARQDGAALTRRCIQAIRHPLVNVITHPANRLVGRRAGYPLDYPAVFAAARESGTALEIDGAPSHLDLDGEHARAAVEAGVTVSIDSDCHRAGALGKQMILGVGTARRGRVERRHVLNSRPVAEVRAFIQAKRGRKGAC